MDGVLKNPRGLSKEKELKNLNRYSFSKNEQNRKTGFLKCQFGFQLGGLRQQKIVNKIFSQLFNNPIFHRGYQLDFDLRRSVTTFFISLSESLVLLSKINFLISERSFMNTNL